MNSIVSQQEPEMTLFSDLPADIVLKIFDYLPFKDGVHAGRVSKRFHEISIIIISKTKDLNLRDRKFDRLTPDQLTSLVNLCKNNLETVELSNDRQLASVFSHFSCPRLATLSMGDVKCGIDVFSAIVANNQHLRHLIWAAGGMSLNYPSGVISESLTMLVLGDCNEATFSALSGRCPNLQELFAFSLLVDHGQILDGFFATVPQIERIWISVLRGVKVASLTHFWRLSSLRSFQSEVHFGSLSANNQFLIKVSESFPQLQKLCLRSTYVSSDGIGALIALPNLLHLQVNCYGTEIDAGVAKLAQCGRLERLTLDRGIVSSTTFVSLFHLCPNLSHFCLDDVSDIDDEPDEILDMFCEAGLSPGRDMYVELDARREYTSVIRGVLGDIAASGGRQISFF